MPFAPLDVPLTRSPSSPSIRRSWTLGFDWNRPGPHSKGGDLDLVERLLDEDLAPADLREGELSLGELWSSYQDARAPSVRPPADR